MMNWYLYLAIFLSAFTASLIATPVAKKIAIKLGAIDVPKARGLNKVPKPRMGGLAIIFGFYVAIFIAFPFISELHTKQFLGFIIGSIFIIILGMLDDINPIRAKKKLLVQIFSALIVVYSGTVISFSNIPFLDNVPFLSEFTTVVWIVGLTNAVNLIDGIDGLAAGVSAICASCIFVLCVITGSTLAIVFSAALAGSALGFLPRNFSPSELIMGDTGSTFLGYVLAVTSIIGVFKGYALMSVIIAVFALALPILDTSFAMLRRFIQGKPIMSPDRGHLHHRLVDKGLSQKNTVLVLYALSFFCGIIAISIAVHQVSSLIIFTVGMVVLFSMIHVYNKRVDADNNNEDISEKSIDAEKTDTEVSETDDKPTDNENVTDDKDSSL